MIWATLLLMAQLHMLCTCTCAAGRAALLMLGCFCQQRSNDG